MITVIYWVDDSYPFNIQTSVNSNIQNAYKVGPDAIKAEMYSLRQLIKHLILNSKPTDIIIGKLVKLETEYPEKII